MNCEYCGKSITSEQTFGEVGQSLCWGCWREACANSIEAVMDELSRDQSFTWLDLSKDKLPDVTRAFAVCRICGYPVYITEICEVDSSGAVMSGGLKIDCSSAPDMDSPHWSIWHARHWRSPYVDWLPLEHKVLRWFNTYYRIKKL